MITIAVWLLIGISDSGSSPGVSSTLAQISTYEECEKTKAYLEKRVNTYRISLYCAPAKIVVAHGG